jgi:hypothetical protein
MVLRCGQKPSVKEVSISLVYALGLQTDQTRPPESDHRRWSVFFSTVVVIFWVTRRKNGRFCFGMLSQIPLYRGP